jgi:glycine/D-amino acid oxidase-like deaminating enzyme
VAKRDSRVTAGQFRHFCKEIGAPVERADLKIRNLFNPALIEDVFITREYVFDAELLNQGIGNQLSEYGVKISLNTRVSEIHRESAESISLTLSQSDVDRKIMARYVFNCSYSGLNQFCGEFPGTARQLVHELTELALVKPPPSLEGLGITVIDGPFFSLMPFPSRGLCSLSHVRYTPHQSWPDRAGIDPYDKLQRYVRDSRFERMQRDVTRFIPSATELIHTESLFEIKTVMSRNSLNDGRPILLEKHPEIGACYSILGGKIDNIYDIFEGLGAEPLDPANPPHTIVKTDTSFSSK